MYYDKTLKNSNPKTMEEEMHALLNRGTWKLAHQPQTLQEKRYMVRFIMSHPKHRVSLQHSVTLSIDTIEGTNW